MSMGRTRFGTNASLSSDYNAAPEGTDAMPRKKMPANIHEAMAAWGSKGGKVKAAKLTAAERKELGKQLAEARKKISPEERRRIAKAAVAKREEYRRQRKET